jgi:predicted RNA methylase
VKSGSKRLPKARWPLLQQVVRSLHRNRGSHAALEVIYRDLFVRELALLGVEDRCFPVGSAANHSLLYLVLRCYVELPVRRVLDVGAGQTSLLLDALRKRLGGADVVTLEHDPAWAKHIGGKVDHPVEVRPLVPTEIDGRTVLMHDLTGIEGPFQFIIMDAPPGVRRHSRYGLLKLVEQVMDRDDFVIVLDDADRAGEWQTARACARLLHREGIGFRHAEVKAAKHQWICAGGRLEPAVYF